MASAKPGPSSDGMSSVCISLASPSSMFPWYRTSVRSATEINGNHGDLPRRRIHQQGAHLHINTMGSTRRRTAPPKPRGTTTYGSDHAVQGHDRDVGGARVRMTLDSALTLLAGAVTHHLQRGATGPSSAPSH